MKILRILFSIILMALAINVNAQQTALHARALPYQGTWGVRILLPTAYDETFPDVDSPTVNAENFNLSTFLAQIDQLTSINHVMININRGHQASWYSGPYPYMENIMGTELFPTRDFFGEVSTALKARGIKVLVYFSVTGMDDGYLTTAQMNTWNAYLTSQGMTHNEGVAQIMEHYSNQYGTNIDGWWVDRVYTFSDADQLMFATALRSGNPNAMVTMHRQTGYPMKQSNKYCDYTSGHPFPLGGANPTPPWDPGNVAHVENIEAGPWINLAGNPSNAEGTALGSVLMPFQNEWRRGPADFPTNQAIEWTSRAIAAGGSWTWAVARIDHGFALAQFAQLVEINTAVENAYGSGSNLALNGTATQSTTLNGAVASRAIDDDTNGNFSGGSVIAAQGPNAWWEVDLGDNYSIDNINIFNRTNNCCINRLSDFTVSVINSSGTTTYSQTVTTVPNPSTSVNAGGAVGQVVRVQSNTTATLNLAEVQVFGESSGGGNGAFVPDPNKTYYIDCPQHNLRLAATGSSEDAYTTSTSTTGNDVEWKFVDNGSGYWHLDRAAGGTKPRLRTDATENADMNQTTANGSKTYYDFAEGASTGTYFLTLPDGPADFNRLQITSTGDVKMVPSAASVGGWVSFTITEASTSSRLLDEMISDKEEISDFSIYPNPASDLLNVNIGGLQDVKVDIINHAGQIVFSQNLKGGSSSIDLSNISSGMYIVKIADGHRVLTKKLIRE